MRDAEQVTFGGLGGLDRAAALRGDAAKLEALWRNRRAEVILYWRGKPLIASGALARLSTDARVLEDGGGRLFLGMVNEVPLFAVELTGWEPAGIDAAAQAAFFDSSEIAHPDLPPEMRFVELRGVMARLSPLDAELAAMARGLFEWHRSHGFCARCGHASEMTSGGWQRSCPSCNAPHFPRTDPVVIMLITHGNRVLLGRSHGWPEGMYSLLAGFIEPGETIEAAVRREVVEESGVLVGEVGYLASQPWPFPASLMIGCTGAALSDEIRLDPVELQDAIWLSKEEMIEVFGGRHAQVRPPRQGAIANYLLQRWVSDSLA